MPADALGYMEAMLPTPSLITDLLRARFPQAMGIYVFGSRTQGHARTDSDLDLAILVPGYVEPLALWDAAQALGDALNLPIDLLDLRAASTVMQHQVLTTGERLWGKDPEAGLFECFALTEKLRLNEAREPQLQDIAREGRIHG
jgi:predicted nucleotidyltransferase